MQILKDYGREIAVRLIRGDAREESCYHALAGMVQDLAAELAYTNVDVTTLPRPTEAGNPDFRVWDGTHQIIGYIEAKAPGSDLRSIEDSDQLKRYRYTFPNIILTDFYAFRLYRDGDLVEQVAIGRPFVGMKLRESPPLEKVGEFTELLEKFLAHSAPGTFQASSLARELAKRTRFLEGIIEHELQEDAEANSRLRGFYEAFHTYLISGLSRPQFADLYAQTITYGLFAARTRVTGDGPFTRSNAADYIPRTIGILKDVFEFISYGKLPENIRWIVDDIAEILHVADIEQILTRYYEEGKGKDPVIHFYETFLTAYDPALREHRGVYYTPESVVSYIVRSVHQILKEEFGKPLGLADSSVTLLDPAAGTLTFIAEAFRVAVKEFVKTYGEEDKPGFIRDHLLEHFYAFELMMAPYAIGHLKMGFILDELGYHLQDDERLKLYLTNTLELEELEQTTLPGMDSLSGESRAAGRIKREEPVLVIIGNPPYSGHSFNDNEWIDGLLKNGYKHDNGQEDDGYYTVDGAPLGEKNPKWLQDDYVKFLRFAQWKIDQYGQGVVGIISNHSYLDNPTFRGMRESLIRSFDKIAVLDLHGNARKKETAPDGSTDENVFDIQQGVAIALLRKTGRKQQVVRGDRYGLREDKNDWLENQSISNTDWTKLQPQSPFYFFKKQDYELAEKYNRYISINALFPLNSVGIVTARDHFVIDFDELQLKRKIQTFCNENYDTQEIAELLNLKSTGTWSLEKARERFLTIDNWEDFITDILYRPFDERKIIYHSDLIERGREEVMGNMLVGENLGICIGRQWSAVGSSRYDVILATDKIIDLNLFRRGGELLFPLYIYPDANNTSNSVSNSTMMMVFEKDMEYTVRKPNINRDFYNLLIQSYGESPTPEQILYYTYALLYAPAYRQTYSEFLKSDFPRVPFPEDYELFTGLGNLGEELSRLYLMKSAKLNTPVTKFQGQGDKSIHKSKKIGRNYQPDEERVYINKDGQYFEGIPPEVWEYHIGGYQVLDKWLYDRRDRRLSNEEIRHYCKVATALYYTIQLQEAIDEIYPAVEEGVITWD